MQKQIQEAEIFLIKKDKVIANLIEKHGRCTIKPHKDFFVSLSSSIISQQLSIKASDSIERKFYANFADSIPTPHSLLQLEDEHFRGCGVSNQKMGYLREIAKYFVKEEKTVNKIHKLSDQEVIDSLVKIKGVGVWTAQMFLMFTLGRIDVFPSGDLGVKNALIKLYGLDPLVKPKEMEEFAQRWHPYRTIASWYLWRSLEK